MENMKKYLHPCIKPAFKSKPYNIYSIRDFLKQFGVLDIGYFGYDVYTVAVKWEKEILFMRGKDLIKFTAQTAERPY